MGLFHKFTKKQQTLLTFEKINFWMSQKYDFTGKYLVYEGESSLGYRLMRFVRADNLKVSYTARCVQRNVLEQSKYYYYLRNEFKILGMIHHNLIQSFIESYIDGFDYYQVVDCEDINLMNYYECGLPGNHFFPFTEKNSSIIFNYLLAGIKVLHKNQIVHLDIRPENILVINDSFKLGGFFKAKIAYDNEYIEGDYGSIDYQAPEIFNGKPYDGFKADVWACGIFLFKILTGKLPFSDSDHMFKENDEQYRQKIKTRILNNEIEYPSYLSDEVVDLLKQIFVNNPSERISLKDIMSHEWTKQSIDFLTENGNLPKRTDDITFESVKTIEEIVSIINTFAKEKQAKVSTRSQKELKFQFEIHEPFKIIFAIKISKINEINQINIKKLRIDSPPNFYRLIKELSIRTSEDVC